MKAVKTTKLKKSYWKLKALKDINFEINAWDFFALLWINWAWKTTIIWILTGLVKKTKWKVEIFWIDIDEDFSSAKKLIWVVPQEFNFDIFMKVIDVLKYNAWYYWVEEKIAEKRAEKILKQLWLWAKRNSEMRELSWWMKRRVMIARALMHEPKLLILDEPTAWVDINIRKDTWEYLKKINKSWTTILLTSHYLEEVSELCNNINIIHKWEVKYKSGNKSAKELEKIFFKITNEK